MKVLSSSEVEELTEHLLGRPDIWVHYEGCWVRKFDRSLCTIHSDFMRGCEACTKRVTTYTLGLKVRNGLPGGMYALTAKPLSWSQEAVEDYVQWLLDKYTAYGMRLKVMFMLAPTVKPTADLHTLSRDLCELHGGQFVKKRV